MSLLKLSTLLLVSSLVSNLLMAETLKGNYELKSSSVEYLVKYLIKKAPGASTQSKGKGECKDKECDFLVAATLKSFESKDANRDLNMLKTTKADKYPLVVAKIKAPSDVNDGKILADIEIEFGGVKKTYSKIPFNFKATDNGFSVDGSFDLALESHSIERPSLLGVDIENLVPITINGVWIKK